MRASASSIIPGHVALELASRLVYLQEVHPAAERARVRTGAYRSWGRVRRIGRVSVWSSAGGRADVTIDDGAPLHDDGYPTARAALAVVRYLTLGNAIGRQVYVDGECGWVLITRSASVVPMLGSRRADAVRSIRAERRRRACQRAERTAATAVGTACVAARAAWSDVAHQRDADGRLIGIRHLLWDGRCLRSPQRETVWPASGVLAADCWSDSAALRGEAGIHARWPLAGEPAPAEYLGTGAIDTPTGTVTVRVLGWGRCVVGELGWRAERAQIVRVAAPDAETRAAIQAAYPEIVVE